MENGITLWEYIDLRMETLRTEGRKATAYNYNKVKRCLRRYRPDDTLFLSDITEEFVSDFNSYLDGLKIQKSTVSFYNRVLRSIYNQAVRERLVKNTIPFDNAYTKVIVKLNPVTSIKTDTGESIGIDEISKEELLRQYMSLRGKYNTLVHKLSAIVGA